MSLHRFSYSPLTAGDHKVGLAGSFSAWQILPMENTGGVYILSLELPLGCYRYKFIVDGNWIIDESNPHKESDAFGGLNSVLIVEEAREKLRWDDVIPRLANKAPTDFLKLYRSGEDAGELRFIWFPSLADEILLHVDSQVVSLSRIGGNTLHDVYFCLIRFLHRDVSSDSMDSLYSNQLTIYNDGKGEFSQDLLLSFTLEILFQGKRLVMDYFGFSQESDISCPLLINFADKPVFHIPDWIGKSIIYQIFPDRFCNGDSSINPDFSEWYYQDCNTPPDSGELLPLNKEYYHFMENWKDLSGLQQNPYLPEGKPDWWSFYGGDIAGVKKKMSYLVDLGISMIYFNPLWQAKSNHKYDSADYHSIDPHFGTTADMIEFVSLAHSQGIKIILDVAFNHTGETFWAFRDCVEKGETSPYWNWYDWKKWPLPKPLPVDFKPKDYYQCWWGIKDMPDLNYDLSRHHPEENAIRNINAAQVNAPLVSYLIDTIRWWLLDIGIDGFRLDVPDEVPFWFWELFRKEVKQAKPDAWIVGEIWHDATEWVSHRYFDSVMNYAYFKNPVIEFFILRIISCKDFIKQIETGLTLYPFHALKSMMNLLGSHDTIRVNELAKGNIARVKLAIVFQMCFIGTPHVYYGDEIALLGAKDPDNRRPFNWDWESDPVAKDLHDFYKQMILFRKSHQVLTEGEITFIPNDNGLLGFKRSFAKESLIVYLNTENQAITIENHEELKEVFQCGKYEDYLLHPLSAVVFFVC